MKKVLVFIFAMLVCTCSTNDDDSQGNTIDPIIGIWQPDYLVEVYKNGNQESEMFSPCERNNRITFGSDGHFFMTNYPEGDDPDCEELVGNLYQSGNWTRLSETDYVVVLTCMNPGCDDTIEERPDEITFPDNNTMRIKEIDDDEDISHYYLYYNRK